MHVTGPPSRKQQSNSKNQLKPRNGKDGDKCPDIGRHGRVEAAKERLLNNPARGRADPPGHRAEGNDEGQ